LSKMKTIRWVMIGQVQGVGFRPFVYRLATALQLSGWVKNQWGQVEIVAQGSSERLTKFSHDLLDKAPPLAKPKIALCEPIEITISNVFQILSSEQTENAFIHVPPDYTPCEDCLKEFYDPADRRYHYPFINCTQCGPRFTIINSLPYDRPNTSMSGFPLCPDCQAEYENPSDRRFHAEPVACPVCGPVLEFRHNKKRGSDGVQSFNFGKAPKAEALDSKITTYKVALDTCVQALHAGKIVAIKGIGGYHLMCDACNDEAVKRLRKLKHRPHKPLAVLFPDDRSSDLSHLKPFVVLEKHSIELLYDPMRPIVLVNRTENSPLSDEIAPALTEVGVMLPCSPLHFLLMDAVGCPLVATSANISGEPILTEAAEIEKRLGHITTLFLHHNRLIVRPADDSVFRFIQGLPRPIRLGRGCTPLELTLPFELAQPTLAVGGQKKNTIALGWQNRVVISAHIGDLGSPRSQAIFEQVIHDLQCLYGVRAERIVCDAHPNYSSSRWAKQSGLPVHEVYHHHAHAAAVAGEFSSSIPWLVFTWDGVGLGEEGRLWGGEALYGSPGQWQRVGTLRPFAPPGGDKASRAPWRSALALCWEAGYQWESPEHKDDLLYQAWQKQLNCPRTSAIGRLFDGAAALTGLVQCASFEGQGPMMLEAACQEEAMPLDLPIHTNSEEVMEINWTPLIPMLLDSRLSVSAKAACFHSSLAYSLCNLANSIHNKYGMIQIGLSGGIFQNRVLCEQVFSLLSNAAGFHVFLGEKLPCNDAALSFGQIIEMATMDQN
jgi:hydrogenase maturation protein HypF